MTSTPMDPDHFYTASVAIEKATGVDAMSQAIVLVTASKIFDTFNDAALALLIGLMTSRLQAHCPTIMTKVSEVIKITDEAFEAHEMAKLATVAANNTDPALN